jgi:hypothetical protein
LGPSGAPINLRETFHRLVRIRVNLPKEQKVFVIFKKKPKTFRRCSERILGTNAPDRRENPYVSFNHLIEWERFAVDADVSISSPFESFDNFSGTLRIKIVPGSYR